MNAEHIEELLANALVDLDEYVSGGNGDVLAIARAEIEAMRTPITPDTLTAAGWVVVYKGISGDIYQCPTSKRIEIGIFDDESTFYLGRRGGVIPVPTNMYDLGELVRLLGGAQ
jgi:hypothetical protein